MTSAFYVARNRQRRQEQAAAEAAAEAAKCNAAFVKDVLRRFDKSKSGGLKFEEVRAWLHAIACSNSSYRGEPISDEQVEWVMRTAMDRKRFKSQKIHDSEKDNIQDMLLKSEVFKRALQLWLDYLRNPGLLALPERNVPVPVNTQLTASETLDTQLHLDGLQIEITSSFCFPQFAGDAKSMAILDGRMCHLGESKLTCDHESDASARG